MNLYQIIGDNVRGFRNKKGWTQEKLASRAEINWTYIGEIERADKKVTIDVLQKLAKKLRVEPYLLLKKDAYKEID